MTKSTAIINGYEVNNVSAYGFNKKWIVAKEVEGVWYYEAASDNFNTCATIAEECYYPAIVLPMN